MNSDLEPLMNLTKIEKENEEVIKHLQDLEHALFLAQDYGALGLARCLEAELVKVKTSLSKATIYNIQLNSYLKSTYGE